MVYCLACISVDPEASHISNRCEISQTCCHYHQFTLIYTYIHVCKSTCIHMYTIYYTFVSFSAKKMLAYSVVGWRSLQEAHIVRTDL